MDFPHLRYHMVICSGRISPSLVYRTLKRRCHYGDGICVTGCTGYSHISFTTSDAASVENFVNMITFPFLFIYITVQLISQHQITTTNTTETASVAERNLPTSEWSNIKHVSSPFRTFQPSITNSLRRHIKYDTHNYKSLWQGLFSCKLQNLRKIYYL